MNRRAASPDLQVPVIRAFVLGASTDSSLAATRLTSFRHEEQSARCAVNFRNSGFETCWEAKAAMSSKLMCHAWLRLEHLAATERYLRSQL
jgi:hypothetical protein